MQAAALVSVAGSMLVGVQVPAYAARQSVLRGSDYSPGSVQLGAFGSTFREPVLGEGAQDQAAAPEWAAVGAAAAGVAAAGAAVAGEIAATDLALSVAEQVCSFLAAWLMPASSRLRAALLHFLSALAQSFPSSAAIPWLFPVPKASLV